MIGDIEIAAAVLAVAMVFAAFIIGLALIVAAGRIKKGLGQ
jgi:hypothetical protein